MFVSVKNKIDGSKHCHNGCECSIDDKGVIDVTKGEMWIASYNPEFYSVENMEGEAEV